MSDMEAVPNPNAQQGQGKQKTDDDTAIAARIAGLSSLKGLVVYGATFTFAGFYIYFMEQIAVAPAGKPPNLSTVMVSAAAALAGVLGSAFALVIGAPTTATNEALETASDQLAALGRNGDTQNVRGPVQVGVWRVLSLEPGGTKRASYPLTFGIWVYALVASAVAIIYFLNQAETPDTIKALATVFAGYVIALMTAAYGMATKSGAP